MLHTAQEGELIRARDERKPDHFWADNEIIEDFLPLMSVYAFSVYMLLCYYVNARTGRCWPSVITMSKRLNVSESTVKRALKELSALKLVRISSDAETLQGDKKVYHPNIYTLSAVNKHTEGAIKPPVDEGGGFSENPGGWVPVEPRVGSVGPTNKTYITRKESILSQVAEAPAIIENQTTDPKPAGSKAIAPKPRARQPWDDVYDEIQRSFFGYNKSGYDAPVSNILNGNKLQKCDGLIKNEMDRHGAAKSELDYPQLARDVCEFAAWYKKAKPGFELKSCNAWLSNWNKWYAQRPKTAIGIQADGSIAKQFYVSMNTFVWRTADGQLWATRTATKEDVPIRPDQLAPDLKWMAQGAKVTA